MKKTPPSAASVHPSIAQTLARTVDSYGIDSTELFAGVGVGMDTELALDKRVDGSVIDELWIAALRATGDDALGIAFAKHFRLGSLHGLGFSWASSDSLIDGFNRLVRYFGVISSAGKVEVRDRGNEIQIVFLLPVPYGIAVDAGIDSSLALFLELCRMVSASKLNPIAVEYQRPEPDSVEAFHSFFNSKIVFNAPENKLIFKKADIDKPLPASNPDLARANDQVVIDYLRKHEQSNTVSKVAMLIIDALPSGAPSQQLIAEQLFMSGKTLQRRLADEGTRFSDLVDLIRTDLAKNYLRQEWRTIGEICYLLGYTEPSNFGRWFKKSVGLSPAEYRSAQ